MSTAKLTPEEAALLISSSKPPSTSTLSRWRREGSGPEYLKIGKAVRYTQEAIESFLSRCTVPSCKKILPTDSDSKGGLA